MDRTYRLWISDSNRKFGDMGKRNTEFLVRAPTHEAGISRLNALVSEKFGFPSTPSAPIRINNRRRNDRMELYHIPGRYRRRRDEP